MSGKKYLIILVAVIVVLFIWFGKTPTDYNLVIEKNSGEKINLRVEIANTEIERGQGLSDRPSLAEQEGLLFVFPTADTYSFWTKDMHFAIDIIWLDDNWQIVDITPNLAPETFPKTFSPSSPAHYVLEVNAGFSATHNLNIGDKITF